MPIGRDVIRLPVESRQLSKLDETGCSPWVYEVMVTLQIMTDEDPPRHRPFSFRLDTKSDVSIIPVNWTKRTEDRPKIRPRSKLIELHTTAGTSPGRMAPSIGCSLPGFPHNLQIDFFVAQEWESESGLLALRDILRFFDFRSEGFSCFPDGQPIRHGHLVLIPRNW